MRKAVRYLLLLILLICLAYGIWSRCGRRAPQGPPQLKLGGVYTFGKDLGAGNLLIVQPYMLVGDYATGERFYRKLSGYLDAAQRHGLINEKTLVLLPEYLGAWLIVAGEKSAVYQMRTTNEATRALVQSNAPSFFLSFVGSEESDRAQAALFRMKAKAMAGIYQQVVARLAKQFGATIVAGSILLPTPTLRDGVLVAGKGPLFNVSVVYGPDGNAKALATKVFLTKDEQRFLRAGSLRDLPVIETAAGRLGILICADSWYPAAYRSLRARRAEIIAVPAFVSGDGKWKKRWNGYDGWPAPDDVDSKDLRHLSEEEAWLKYALPGRLESSGASAGCVAFLRGELWDLGSDGASFGVLGGRLHVSPLRDGAAIVNLWLPRRLHNP